MEFPGDSKVQSSPGVQHRSATVRINREPGKEWPRDPDEFDDCDDEAITEFALTAIREKDVERTLDIIGHLYRYSVKVGDVENQETLLDVRRGLESLSTGNILDAFFVLSDSNMVGGESDMSERTLTLIGEALEGLGEHELAVYAFWWGDFPQVQKKLEALGHSGAEIPDAINTLVASRRKEYFNACVAEHPEDAYAWYQVVQDNYSQDQEEDDKGLTRAISTGLRAVEQPNALYRTFDFLVRTLRDANRLEDAQRVAERATVAYPGQGQLYALIGKQFVKQGKPDRAIDAFQRSLANLFDPDIAKLAAEVMREAGYYQELVELLERCLAHEQDKQKRREIAGSIKEACRQAGCPVPLAAKKAGSILHDREGLFIVLVVGFSIAATLGGMAYAIYSNM
ncbi:hypothetical protein KKF84_07960 [Myxococcota bacterium]|nr:hypothetical protein [Myxococcota bacterium]